MFEVISSVLSLVGTAGLILAIYKSLVDKRKETGNLILAFSCFAVALSEAAQPVADRSYVVMIIEEILAIKYFRDYIKEKEA